MLTLTFTLPSADLIRLARHPAIAALRSSRARSRIVTTIWHDTPDNDLADSGLALAHSGRTWRLERVQPSTEPWPPGSPPPVIGAAKSAEGLGVELPPGLAPKARFNGREDVYRPW